MTQTIRERLTELGIELPTPSVPAANYVPVVLHDGVAYVAGQIPWWNGEIRYKGKVGGELDVASGQAAARLCALNILAHLENALGSLDRIDRFLKIGGFVNQAPGFADHPKVMNGASDLLAEVFGERGRHARAAVGTAGLPFDVAVEVDAVVAYKLS